MSPAEREQLSSVEARVLGTLVSGMRDDLAEVKDTLSDLSAAVNKLALIEAKQVEASSATDRAFVAIDRIGAEGDRRSKDLEKRLTALEIAMPPLQEMRRWVVAGILAGLGMMLLALVKMVLVDPHVVYVQSVHESVQSGQQR